jgi:hypothetical protein
MAAPVVGEASAPAVVETIGVEMVFRDVDADGIPPFALKVSPFDDGR